MRCYTNHRGGREKEEKRVWTSNRNPLRENEQRVVRRGGF